MNPFVPRSLHPQTVSPLVLMDRLISLARDADLAGHARTASGLIALALAVCDGSPASAAGWTGTRASRSRRSSGSKVLGACGGGSPPRDDREAAGHELRPVVQPSCCC